MLEVNHEGFDDETRIVKTYEFEKKAKAVTTAVTDVTENHLLFILQELILMEVFQLYREQMLTC